MAQIIIDCPTLTKNQWKTHCKKHKTSMTEAMLSFINFCLEKNISPESIDIIFNKNIKGQVADYHNFTVGFLKTFEKKQIDTFSNFEKKQLAILESFLYSLKHLISKYNIEKGVQDEILFDVQVIAKLLNPAIAETIITRNNDNIINAENNEKLKNKKA